MLLFYYSTSMVQIEVKKHTRNYIIQEILITEPEVWATPTLVHATYNHSQCAYSPSHPSSISI